MKTIVNELLEVLVASQATLKDDIEASLPTLYKGDRYLIYAKDDKPKPMLCVHLDTINTHSVTKELKTTFEDFEYDENLGVIALNPNSSLSCLGGDDRAGVWIALKLIEHMEATNNFKYNIGFFEDEEIGCHGSYCFSLESEALNVVINTTCYIGLDRRSPKGAQEVALYGYDNRELTDTFVALGYSETLGSVTDASELANDSIACCTLSVGYDKEHSKDEVIYVKCMVDTLEVLKALELPDKPYTPEVSYNSFDYGYDNDAWYLQELEAENRVLKDELASLGCDVTALLEEYGIYSESYYEY